MTYASSTDFTSLLLVTLSGLLILVKTVLFLYLYVSAGCKRSMYVVLISFYCKYVWLRLQQATC